MANESDDGLQSDTTYKVLRLVLGHAVALQLYDPVDDGVDLRCRCCSDLLQQWVAADGKCSQQRRNEQRESPVKVGYSHGRQRWLRCRFDGD